MTRAWREAVAVHGGARRAWPFLPSLAPPGSTWQGEGGALVRILGDGSADQVLQGGLPHGGAAGDPVNSGRPRRYP